MAVITLRDELCAAVESRHSGHHSYYQLSREGRLPREAIAGWDEYQAERGPNPFYRAVW